MSLSLFDITIFFPTTDEYWVNIINIPYILILLITYLPVGLPWVAWQLKQICARGNIFLNIVNSALFLSQSTILIQFDSRIYLAWKIFGLTIVSSIFSWTLNAQYNLRTYWLHVNSVLGWHYAVAYQTFGQFERVSNAQL